MARHSGAPEREQGECEPVAFACLSEMRCLIAKSLPGARFPAVAPSMISSEFRRIKISKFRLTCEAFANTLDAGAEMLQEAKLLSHIIRV